MRETPFKVDTHSLFCVVILGKKVMYMNRLSELVLPDGADPEK